MYCLINRTLFCILPFEWIYKLLFWTNHVLNYWSEKLAYYIVSFKNLLKFQIYENIDWFRHYFYVHKLLTERSSKEHNQRLRVGPQFHFDVWLFWRGIIIQFILVWNISILKIYSPLKLYVFKASCLSFKTKTLFGKGLIHSIFFSERFKIEMKVWYYKNFFQEKRDMLGDDYKAFGSNNPLKTNIPEFRAKQHQSLIQRIKEI